MIRSLSFDNILNKKIRIHPFSKDFMDAFGKRQKSGAWIVYGKSGQGKTSFTFQLAREFDRIGYKVLFISLEMGVESDFRDSPARIHEFVKERDAVLGRGPHFRGV